MMLAVKTGDIRFFIRPEPVLIKPEEADILQVEMPAAVFSLEHLFIDFNDRPVSWGWFVCSSARLRLHTRIGLENAMGSRDERTR